MQPCAAQARAAKTLGYMAAEKPVVSTAVHDVVTLYGDQIRIAGDTENFIAQCRAALAKDAAQRSIGVVTMRAAMTRSSWDWTAKAIRLLIDAAAGGTESLVPMPLSGTLPR